MIHYNIDYVVESRFGMEYIIFILLAYLLGSIPFALVVGKIGFNKDIRNYGSGNLGATNAFRILGVKAGIIVTLADILKGTLATLLPVFASFFVDVEVSRLIIGLFAVLGHTYPIFAKFKGGKAVATSGGVVLGLNPLLFLLILLTFFITLYITKYVSLTSMITGVISTILAFFFKDYLLFALILGLTIFIIIRHRENIERIKNRTEPKINWL